MSDDPQSDELSPFHSDRLGSEMDDGRSPTLAPAASREWRRLTDGLRRAISSGVDLDAPAERLGALADAAHELADRLQQAATGRVAPLYGAGPAGRNEEEQLSNAMPFSPISGIYNPIAPPLTFTRSDSPPDDAVGVKSSIERVRIAAAVTYGAEHQGAPGLVHGAMISAAYDEVLAMANMVAGVSGPTARLTIRYRKPTPLGQPLRFESWIDKSSERYTFTRGHCLLGDEIVTDAEGLFARIP